MISSIGVNRNWQCIAAGAHDAQEDDRVEPSRESTAERGALGVERLDDVLRKFLSAAWIRASSACTTTRAEDSRRHRRTWDSPLRTVFSTSSATVSTSKLGAHRSGMRFSNPANMADLKCAGQMTLVRTARACEAGWYRCRSSSVRPSWKERAATLEEQSVAARKA